MHVIIKQALAVWLERCPWWTAKYLYLEHQWKEGGVSTLARRCHPYPSDWDVEVYIQNFNILLTYKFVMNKYCYSLIYFFSIRHMIFYLLNNDYIYIYIYMNYLYLTIYHIWIVRSYYMIYMIISYLVNSHTK
jgi:hypothetical protein